MGLKTGRAVALSVVLLMGVTASAGANLIAYVTQTGPTEWLMVMEDDGTNSVELFAGDRDTPTIEYPSVSPAGLQATWILFNDHYDLYRTPPAGTGQTLVLCGAGTDNDGAPYYLGAFDAHWSPNGSEILVAPTRDPDTSGGFFLALVPGNHTTDATCTSALEPIYTPSSPWTIDNAVAWNHDGSQIVFLETNLVTEDQDLVVIERQETDVWERVETIHLIPGSQDLPDGQPFQFSWQPLSESRLLVFRLKGFPERKVRFWLATIDLDTGIWDYVLDHGSPVQLSRDSYVRWSSSGDEILFTDPDGNLVRWGYPDGPRQVIGSGIRADWQRDLPTDCGDGVCEGGETSCSCPDDCGAPPSYEDNCANGFDDDCDGWIDCADVDCNGYPACLCEPTETSCTDGVDNDCDTDIDCFDTDCDGDPVCAPPVDCSMYNDKQSCNSDPGCRWDNRAKACVPN